MWMKMGEIDFVTSYLDSKVRVPTVTKYIVPVYMAIYMYNKF